MYVTSTDPHKSARVEGTENGASVSLVVSRNQPGEGTRLHRHPYDETWVVSLGQVLFEAEGTAREVGPGDVVNVPAGTPHKFTNVGSESCELVCIHPSPTIIQENLE
jgi:quercetin dioxygenase-like cupin family protein